MELTSQTNQHLREKNEQEAVVSLLTTGKEKDEERDSVQIQKEQQQEEETTEYDEDEKASTHSEGKSKENNNDDEDDDDSDDEDDDDSDDEDDDDDVISFLNDDDANMARSIGLKYYNEGQYENALTIQYRIVRYFDKKYKATSSICGPYFLDYGLSQLRLLQLKNTVDAVLQPLDHEALESCFINLDIARVCFQKQEDEEKEKNNNINIQLRLAEVHNAIAQLHMECEDVDNALKEYESELLTYRYIQQEAPDQLPYNRLVGVLYGIADCYMKEGDFEGAEERYTQMLEEIDSFPKGTIDEDLLSELKELREDAKEMKGGKYKILQEYIQTHFAVKEAEGAPTAQEFYGHIDKDHKLQNPYVSHLPDESEYSALSMPQSLTHPIQWNEHSNSMSLSLFPPQTNSCSQEISNSQPIHHVVARRKPKKILQHEISQEKEKEWRNDINNTGESDVKRIRTESCS